MSEETVEQFTGLIKAFNDRDIQRLLDVLDPDIEFQPQQAALEGDYYGHHGVAGWLTDLADVYEDGSVELTQVRDLGDRVLAFGTLRFIAKGSGIQTEFPVAFLATFRDGLMTRCKDYGDQDQALEAAGLSE